MADRSKIEWTDASWTPIRARWLTRDPSVVKIGWHCEHVSEACRNCYAEAMNRRLGTGLDFKPGSRDDIYIFLDEKMLLQPVHWKRSRMIFVCSMSDLFADFVPDEFIDKIFAIMALCPQHTFQVLTKRPKRMRKYVTGCEQAHFMDLVCSIIEQEKIHDGVLRIEWPLPNVWLGTSCEDQATADERIPDLLATPAPIRFISAEPLLGPIDLRMIRLPPPIDDRFNKLDWVIVGGESGPHARPMLRSWAQSLRDHCAAAVIPFLFKQHGEWIDADEWFDGLFGKIFVKGEPFAPNRPLNFEDAAIVADVCGRRQFEHHSGGSTLIRVGKHAAGRLLDGVEHNAFPEAR